MTDGTRTWWLHIGAILLATLGCYLLVWNGYFKADDFRLLGELRNLSFEDGVLSQRDHLLRLPLEATHWLRVKAFDVDPAPYYWTAIFQHALAGGVV